MITNAVFQGGGVKGIALVGALEKLEEIGARFDAVSGTSAGSIVAALYAAGYTAGEMKSILVKLDFSQLLDPFKFKYPFFLRNRGLYKGGKLYDWIYRLLAEKQIYTFSDLESTDLKIVAADLTNHELLVFDRNSNPNLKIAEAVRMSLGIPLFFKPYPFGEKIVVDGGVLSNFPLFTFNDPDATLGLKIVSESLTIPKAPRSIMQFLWSIVETMMDAHDKEEVQRSGQTNIIEIGNAGISSVKFGLSNSEKEQLFKNGYFAASKFISDNSDFLENIRKKKLRVTAQPQEPIIVIEPDGLQPNESIRVSVSALYRILVDGKFMLIKGNRIDQFQPVGGVFKRFASARSVMRELSVTDDDKFPIDDSSRDDLRVRVPYTSLVKFLEWLLKETDRESSPWREFYEELVLPKVLPLGIFPHIYFELVKRHVEGIRFSKHFNCHEMLIAYIYELMPTSEQLTELRKLQSSPSDSILWADAPTIQSRGYDPVKKADIARISEHSEWIL